MPGCSSQSRAHPLSSTVKQTSSSIFVHHLFWHITVTSNMPAWKDNCVPTLKVKMFKTMHTNSYPHRKEHWSVTLHHNIPFFLVPCLTFTQTKSSPFSESPNMWRSSSTSLTLLGHITQKASPGWYSKAVSCFKTWNISIKSYYKPRHSHFWQQPS